MARRVNKYNSRWTEVDGIKFQSGAEARRYSELKLLQMGKQISNLRLQVEYPLKVGDLVVGAYFADFVYEDPAGSGRTVVEDVKGYKTDIYQLKKKLMLACYGISILETR